MRCVVILLDLTHAHVQQDSQGMDSHALVSHLSLISFFMICLFFEWTTTTAMQNSFVLFSLFTVKVLVWQEFKLILVLMQCLCAKAQHCHVILQKSLKPYLLKHKNNKQTRTKKMDTFTLATRCKPSGRFNISYSNALRNLQFSCRYRRVFYQLSQLWR